MSYKFNDDTPIYLQIIEQIKTDIISGNLQPNQKLPSVRELSFEYEVNPNTIQKALFELENVGLIYTERTNGKFVTDNSSLIQDTKQSSTEKIIEDFYSSMAKLGIDSKTALQILNNKKERK